MSQHDAIVVGSGPNGLAAAITLQRAGLGVLLLEAKATIGGGLRTAELTLPGFHHDVCSTIHPMAVESSVFAALPLARHGLTYIDPPVLAAHPLDGGMAANLLRDFESTALGLGRDAETYRRIFAPLLKSWPLIASDILGPFGRPKHPLAAARFGRHALASAQSFARHFETVEARALWAGLAAHSIQPFSKLTTSAIGIVLTLAGHRGGWPLARGGSASIASALARYFTSSGGKIQTDVEISSLQQLPSARAVIFDVTPRQLLRIAGDVLSPWYRAQLRRFRYGPGVFKIDWALSSPAPFTAASAREAGTVHLGGTFEEIAQAEYDTSVGRHAEKPFALFTQPSRFDPTRAPAGRHTAAAYCHVPHGSSKDQTTIIEAQVERFAPGFRDLILARHTFNAVELERHNPNYVGGDITGGVVDLAQLISRPALRSSPYRTSKRGLYLCSASTPPGGGVHGLGGYHAAQRVLKDIFGAHPARENSLAQPIPFFS